MRTLRPLIVIVALATGAGIVGLPWLRDDPEAARLAEENRRLLGEQEALQRVVARLTGERRVAQLLVVDQQTDANGAVETTIKLQELDRDGRPLAAQRFRIAGDVIYFDALLIKFEDTITEAAAPLQGKSLVLFRRVFGESQTPEDGFPIDPVRRIPGVYRPQPEPDHHEQHLWNRFWDYATDPASAAEAGVRVAQGEAVYNRFRKGQFWVLTLENDGGLNLLRHDLPAVVTEHLRNH